MWLQLTVTLCLKAFDDRLASNPAIDTLLAAAVFVFFGGKKAAQDNFTESFSIGCHESAFYLERPTCQVNFKLNTRLPKYDVRCLCLVVHSIEESFSTP